MTTPDTQPTDEHAPNPDHPVKPDSPKDLWTPTWRYSLQRAVREFSADNCLDLAAALTYYGVLAMFPALLAIVSLLGLVGQDASSIDTVLALVRDVAPADVAGAVEPVLTGLTEQRGAGLALVLGLAGALWSASGYVGAFGRALNRVYEVEEGRPFWKLRPTMLVVTLVLLVLVVLLLVLLVAGGPVAEAVGSAIGLGSTAVTVWSIARWPLIAVVVVVLVALLYHLTPNVKQPKLRWISPGALLAIVAWLVASAAFALYVANFSSYDRTYGSLAGVVVFLLWLWITNLALLLGAELDAEMERGRELQAGLPAEQVIQLPARDSSAADKKAAKEAEVVARGRMLREQRAEDLQREKA
ncbi:YihY/virulence factor BrkB family protein [Angustibacter speluncae]